jgi:hypothetical protein
MKKITLFYFLSFAVVLMFISACSEDDDETVQPKNFVKIGGTTYELGSGFYENYGESLSGDYEGFNIDLYLFSNGIKINSNGSDYEMSGEGQILYFELFSEKGEYIPSGNYFFSASETIGTFDIGIYALNWEPEEENTVFYDIASGTVDITRNGSEYAVNLDLVDSDGTNISGEYEGTLNYIDSSTKKSKTFFIQ